MVRRAEYTHVLTAAAQLRTADQEVLRLAAWEGLPHVEIAKLLNISVAAVDQRLHRAKKRLADAFEKNSSNAGSRTAAEGEPA